MVLYSLLLIGRMVSVTHQRSSTPPPSSPPRGEWPALTLDTHHHDAVARCCSPCIHLNSRPLLSLLLAKLASSTSPQKPPATYTPLIRRSMIVDHIRTRFLGGQLIRESDLHASIYGDHGHAPFPRNFKDHIRTDLETCASNLKCVALTVLELLTFNAQISD